MTFLSAISFQDEPQFEVNMMFRIMNVIWPNIITDREEE